MPAAAAAYPLHPRTPIELKEGLQHAGTRTCAGTLPRPELQTQAKPVVVAVNLRAFGNCWRSFKAGSLRMPANQIQYSEKYYDEVGGSVHIMQQVVPLSHNAPPPLCHVGPRLTVCLLLRADLRVQARCGTCH